MKADERPDAGSPPSRSQRKREHQALQELAAELAALPESQVHRLELDADIRQEIRVAHAMKASGARNRQLRHIAQQLLQHDPQSLRMKLTALTARDREQVAREQRAAALREHVLEHGETALDLTLDAADSARLTELRRIVLAGADATRARHARREIYRLILGLIGRK